MGHFYHGFTKKDLVDYLYAWCRRKKIKGILKKDFNNYSFGALATAHAAINHGSFPRLLNTIIQGKRVLEKSSEGEKENTVKEDG